MTELCTCGARPPEDALFCHKCGRPLRSIVEPELLPEPPPGQASRQFGTQPLPADAPAIAPADSPAVISLRNRRAVRTGLGIAAVVVLLEFVQMPSFLQPMWVLTLLLSGGFFAVYIYQRRTGENISTLGGARLGWITGLFVFLITMVVFTGVMLAIASQGEVREFFVQATNAQNSPETRQQLETLLSSGSGVAALVIGILFFSFFFLTILSSIGGALAAKVLEKD